MGAIARSNPKNLASGHLRLLAVVAALLFLALADAKAVTINVPILTTPIDLTTTPTIRVLSHGPVTEKLYRITLLVENPETACLMRVALPTDSLRIWKEGDGRIVESPNANAPNAISVRYDGDPTLHYARRFKPISQRIPPNPGTRQFTDAPWTTSIPVAPGGEAGIDLDFDLPDTIPEELTLSIQALDMGCGVMLSVEKQFPLAARDILLRARQATDR